jgi:hypothetical protein
MQGEDQKKLDIVANEVFINVLRRSGQCSVLVGPSTWTFLTEEIALQSSLHSLCHHGALTCIQPSQQHAGTHSGPDETVLTNPFDVISDRFLKRLMRRSS